MEFKTLRKVCFTYGSHSDFEIQVEKWNLLERETIVVSEHCIHDMTVVVSSCNKFTSWKISIYNFKTYSILLISLIFMLLSQALTVTSLCSIS